MISPSVKALLISSRDSESQFIAELVQQIEHRSIELTIVPNASAAQLQLQNYHFDILLISTDSDFEERIALIRGSHDSEQIEPCAIVLSHSNDYALYQVTMQAGAFDSLSIEDLTPTLLDRSIHYAIHQKADEIRLLKLAYHDPLTGIANRLAFKNRLDEMMAQTRRANQMLALMMIDLDNFKRVNDQIGHDAGDELLINVAERLQNSIRETDTVARLGGDEFAIIATQLHSATDAATMARALLNACLFQVDHDIDPFNISCSIGIAVYPDDGHDYSQLLKQADIALLEAKKTGRGTFLFANPGLNQLTQKEQQLNEALSFALPRNQLDIHFQPIVAVSNQQITGVEALLRWRHPTLGLLKPEQFLSAAEDSGLINAIGSWVIRKACQQHMTWRSQGLPAIPVAVNLSSVQLEHQYLVNTVTQLVEKEGFDPSQLILELSESDIVRCSTQASDTLFELHGLGVKLTIDNFGKEYCSLNKLHSLPIDTIKIDRSLVHRLRLNDDSSNVTGAVIQLCKVLNLDVVAQGVEDAQSMRYLHQHHCQNAQGYYISMPMEASFFPSWFKQYGQDHSLFFH